MSARSDTPRLQSRYLKIVVENEVISVSFQPSSVLTLGSGVRAREARNRILSKFKRTSHLSLTEDGKTIRASFPLSSVPRLQSILAKE